MFNVHSDKSGQLLTMSFSKRVGTDEMQRCIYKTKRLLTEMKPGFRLLTDLTHLEFMDACCAVYFSQVMELCNAGGVSHVTRVVPNAKLDVGFQIMSLFHFNRDVQTMEFSNLADAMRSLAG